MEKNRTTVLALIGLLAVCAVCGAFIACCHESEQSFRHAVDAGRPVEVWENGFGPRVHLIPDAAPKEPAHANP